jgi:hypothetical protein
MPKTHARKIVLPLAAYPNIPRRAWWEALVGSGGKEHSRLLYGSGCTAITLKTDTGVRARASRAHTSLFAHNP